MGSHQTTSRPGHYPADPHRDSNRGTPRQSWDQGRSSQSRDQERSSQSRDQERSSQSQDQERSSQSRDQERPSQSRDQERPSQSRDQERPTTQSRDNYNRNASQRPSDSRHIMFVVDDGGSINNVRLVDINASLFETKQQRRNFVRNVYALLTLMVVVDALFVTLALLVEPIHRFVYNNIILFICSLAIFIIVYFSLMCFSVLRRKKPVNYILLAILDISMGFLLAVITVQYKLEVVIFAVAGTFIVVLSVSLFAALCPCDITGCILYILVASVVCTVAALVIIIVCALGLCGANRRFMMLGISIVFVLLFSFYLAYDTQMLLGGGKYRLPPDAYIDGAVHLWTDIINIFLCSLIMGNALRS